MIDALKGMKCGCRPAVELGGAGEGSDCDRQRSVFVGDATTRNGCLLDGGRGAATARDSLNFWV